MANKISLANKYRPQKFEDVIEQDAIKVVLTNQIKTNNLKHAYLFCGSAGTGKTTSARIIANMMNDNNGKPIELDCASHNGVDDMRMIIEECKTRPLKGKYKTFVLDECQMLTIQAWNSLLKILEEPPEYVIFLFCTTDPQKIIGTIMSRVQRFNFQRISVNGIYTRLGYIIKNENEERKKLSEELITGENVAIKYIARLANGGLRNAITLLEKCLDYNNALTLKNVLAVTSGGISEDTLLNFLKQILNRDCKESLLNFNNIYMSGIDVSVFLKLLIQYLQNCIKYIITQVADITNLSDITINWLSEAYSFLPQMRELLKSLISIQTQFSNEDLKIIIESWIIEKCN